jgi:hypothetical protein
LLLERIDKLEKRLADLESRVAAKPPDNGAAMAKPSTDRIGSGHTSTETNPSTEVKQEAGNPSKPKKSEPFAFADWSWLTGNARTKQLAADSKFFTPEIRADVSYTSSFNHPQDNTIGGSSEIFRSGEVVLTQLGLGGDFHYDNVRARVMTQIGMYSQTQPRNDSSVARGQWNLDNAYRYISEAYGGYHLDKMHGINVDAGIFLSYIGLWSFYNFDNWTYQPSFVSSNTPWFFTGMRIQFANNIFYNVTTTIAMMAGCFALPIPALALAGSFAAQGRRPASLGTLPAYTLNFGVLVVGTALIIGLLSYFPVLALGSILEHLLMKLS